MSAQLVLFDYELPPTAWKLRAGLAYVIAYEDGGGRETTREIRVIDDLDSTFLWAHCYLRGDERCFRRDRVHVLSVSIDDATGRRTKLSQWASQASA